MYAWVPCHDDLPPQNTIWAISLSGKPIWWHRGHIWGRSAATNHVAWTLKQLWGLQQPESVHWTSSPPQCNTKCAWIPISKALCDSQGGSGDQFAVLCKASKVHRSTFLPDTGHSYVLGNFGWRFPLPMRACNLELQFVPSPSKKSPYGDTEGISEVSLQPQTMLHGRSSSCGASKHQWVRVHWTLQLMGQNLQSLARLCKIQPQILITCNCYIHFEKKPVSVSTLLLYWNNLH